MDRMDEEPWSRMRFSRSAGMQGNNHGRLNRPHERYRLAGPADTILFRTAPTKKEAQAVCNSL